MADYTIISDVSNFILSVLRAKMCPEPIPSPNNIEVSSPASQDVDYILGLYLYDIKEDDTVAPPPTIRRGKLQLTPPPKPYSLYYMVFVNAGSSESARRSFQTIIPYCRTSFRTGWILRNLRSFSHRRRSVWRRK